MHSLLKSKLKILLFLFFIGLAFGFYLTAPGFETWDSNSHLDQSRWLVFKFLGQEVGRPHPFVVWYGPMWETFLGIFSEGIFRFLNDSTWVRYSVNFATLPVFLGILFFQLRRFNVSRVDSFLALALILSNVRILGHTLMNTKDFPLAFIYLIVSFYFIQVYLDKPKLTKKFLFFSALISLIPYLIRPPMLLHAVVFWSYVMIRQLNGPSPLKNLLKTFVRSIGYSFFWIYILWPTLWPFQLRGWIDSFVRFSKFPLTGLNQAYGVSFDVSQIPSWYFWSWFPVIFHPIGLMAILMGLGLLIYFIFRKKLTLTGFQKKWVYAFLLFALLPLVTILLKKPVLYDEERHLMFLFPLFCILAAIGLSYFRDSIKIILATSMITLSLISFFQWGKYTYIYKSPIVTRLGYSNGFLGDYWGVCINEAARQLPRFINHSASITTHAPRPALELQAKRLKNSRLLGDLNYPDYLFADGQPSAGNIIIAYNRFGATLDVFNDVASQKATLLWQDFLPTGEPGCIIATYPKK